MPVLVKTNYNMIKLTEDTPIRALSWKQPFAQLMMHGKIETRVWPTNYRGLVLMCASVSWYPLAIVKEIAGIEQFARIIKSFEQEPGSFETGVAFGIGRLADCRRMTQEDEQACYVKYQEPWKVERLVRGTLVKQELDKMLWCHIYEDVTPIKRFLFKGRQRWSNITMETRKQIILL